MNGHMDHRLHHQAAGALHKCTRCGRETTPHAHSRSQQAFQRTFCDACFDEAYLGRRNFDTKVDLNKTIVAKVGTLVQSERERLIADWLTAHNIAFRYDQSFRILNGYAIGPDFYLPELDVYIEYWGMDTADYKIGMLKKQQLYQQQGKRLISLTPADKQRLDTALCTKLALFGYHPASASASEPAKPIPCRTIDVAAALVFRTGKLLITQRFPHAHLGGLWEFPGGKRQPDETFEACLVRELTEELGIEVTVGELLQKVVHSYPQKTVHLQFYRCLLVKGEPQPLDCPAFSWIDRQDLTKYEFPAADSKLVQRLRLEPKLWD